MKLILSSKLSSARNSIFRLFFFFFTNLWVSGTCWTHRWTSEECCNLTTTWVLLMRKTENSHLLKPAVGELCTKYRFQAKCYCNANVKIQMRERTVYIFCQAPFETKVTKCFTECKWRHESKPLQKNQILLADSPIAFPHFDSTAHTP